MASTFIIDINNNDDLSVVIRKCNANFKAIMSQQSKQSQIDKADAANQASEIIGDAVGGLVNQIEHERDLRIAADLDLDNAIDTLAGSMTAVATTGNYSDLINKPEDVLDGAYLTFGMENPATAYGGTWNQEGTLTIGSSVLNIWKRIA